MNIGERIGDYEVIAVLGAGGMGQVYKVRNTLSERVEAMKVLLPKLEGDPGLADRFLREIKVQATFDHPNIAKFYTAMRVGDQLLMFMEFIDGVSVSKELEKGPLAPGEAAAYTAQVLDALAYAHSRGVVHRDIKPPNIMITDAGVAKLMDFGIARAQADTRLTQTGNAVGSLSYMSPEQINGGDPDPRSDIYSLGIALYEMVTGKRPFAGDSGYAIMSAHLKETPVAPIQLTPSLPPDLSEIILMAIAKDPGARFQTASAFRGALVNVFPGIAAPLRSPDTTQTMPLGAPIVAKPPSAKAPADAAPISTASVAAPPVPVPPPVAVPLPPANVTSSGRRGIYMALGSVVTLAVLVAAVIYGPRLMHGGSSDADVKGAPAATSAAPASSAASNDAATAAPPAPATADLTASAPPPDASLPAPSAPTSAASAASSNSSASASASASASISAAASASAAPAKPAPVVVASARPVAQASTSAPAGQSADWHRLPENPAPAPAQTAQNFAPPPAPQAAPATPPPPAVNPELVELRQKFNETSIRASTARGGLNSFQQQQARQGLGLRADIREAQTRMDFQLQEAQGYLQRGDIEDARTSLRYAQSAVETIEKFLGR